jgi:protein-S-isoprenylcysteine O-methyltransferase Ste14
MPFRKDSIKKLVIFNLVLGPVLFLVTSASLPLRIAVTLAVLAFCNGILIYLYRAKRLK